jgi:hypothetical protein
MPIQDGVPGVPDSGKRDGERHFVNHLRLVVSLSDIRFDLALLGAPQEPSPTWHFVTTPDHLATMHEGFAVAIDRYRARYGEIRGAPADPALVSFTDGDKGG